MADNFDFLKKIDEEHFELIQDAQKLFRDEYFNQCVVQLRIFAEKMSKKILDSNDSNMTFDDTLNCLKDKIKTQREQEFIDDLFFIKQQGNKCAHGEDIAPSVALEAIQRAFEAAINYVYSKKKDEKINKLQFDATLLITGKPQKEVKLVDKYIELANQEKEELLNSKQGEFHSQVEKKDENGFKDESFIQNPKKYKEKKKKELTPTQKKIKEKVKNAKKNLKQNINASQNKKPKKQTKKQLKTAQEKRYKIIKLILFLSFVTISLSFITKMLFFL